MDFIRKNRLIAISLLVFLGLVCIVGVVAITPALANGVGLLWLNPPAVSIPPGGSADVVIQLNDVTNVYGAQVSISFDPAVLEVVDADGVKPGVQISTGTCPAPDFVVTNSADNVAGTIGYAVTQLNPTPACAGGDIATIEFQCVATGVASDVTFPPSTSIISDPDGIPIPHNTQNGTVTCLRPGVIPADFDGDGLSDIGFFRAPFPGLWGILKSTAAFDFNNAQWFSWGQDGDLPVLGDYDGDGKADPTVRRPPAGGQSAAILALLSSTGYDYGQVLTIPAGWPSLGDTPVPADYDGDGMTDPAVWRESLGVWIIPLSGGSYSTYIFTSWGVSGDSPVGADVDGDGMADIGFYRASLGLWGFLKSSSGYSTGDPMWFSWGGSADTPMMEDYDGDGLADPAFVTPPAGGQSAAYRILLSSTGYDYGQSLTIPAGWPSLGDTPVPADVDGDGKADPGVWRESNGVWIIAKSSCSYSCYLFALWGQSGDVALPNRPWLP